MQILLAILALGVLVVVHEAGHYFVARWSRMRVERFSIGFGPPILKWRHGETQFQVAPVPFGGFVQITGMNPHEEFDEKDPNVYPNRPAVLRFLTILAGPAMNYVAAVVVVLSLNLIAGVGTGRSFALVKDTTPNEPAAGKLMPNDKVLAVDGVDVYLYSRDGSSDRLFNKELQASKGQPVVLTVLRDGQKVDVPLTPAPRTLYADKVRSALAQVNLPFEPFASLYPPTYMIGVQLRASEERVDVGAGTAFASAARYPVETTQFILSSLWQVVTGEVDGELTGPVGIVGAIDNSFSLGWVTALEFLAMLNVYLGLFNLLPFPGLDGGRLAFLTYELATRRRANPRVEAAVHMFGFLFLFLVLIVVTFKDVGRFFGL